MHYLYPLGITEQLSHSHLGALILVHSLIAGETDQVNLLVVDLARLMYQYSMVFGCKTMWELLWVHVPAKAVFLGVTNIGKGGKLLDKWSILLGAVPVVFRTKSD